MITPAAADCVGYVPRRVVLQAVTNACKKHGGFYLGSIGGPAAILAKNCIKKVGQVWVTDGVAYGPRSPSVPVVACVQCSVHVWVDGGVWTHAKCRSKRLGLCVDAWGDHCRYSVWFRVKRRGGWLLGGCTGSMLHVQEAAFNGQCALFVAYPVSCCRWRFWSTLSWAWRPSGEPCGFMEPCHVLF